MQHSLWDRIWRDHQGRVVIFQWPNAWLIAWAILAVISLAVSGRLADVCSWASHASLIVWAIIELTKGVNYFRRALGLVVLIFAILSLINNL